METVPKGGTKNKESTNNAFACISKIEELEGEMNRLLRRRRRDRFTDGAKGIFGDLKVALRGFPEQQREGISPKTKKSGFTVLKPVYENLIEEFENLKSTENGPLSYMQGRDIDKIIKQYDMDKRHFQGMDFDIDMQPTFYGLGNAATVMTPIPVAVALLNTEKNRDNAREVVDDIITNLKVEIMVSTQGGVSANF